MPVTAIGCFFIPTGIKQMEMILLAALFGFFFCGGRAPSAMEEAKFEEKASLAFKPKQ